MTLISLSQFKLHSNKFDMVVNLQYFWCSVLTFNSLNIRTKQLNLLKLFCLKESVVLWPVAGYQKNVLCCLPSFGLFQIQSNPDKREFLKPADFKIKLYKDNINLKLMALQYKPLQSAVGQFVLYTNNVMPGSRIRKKILVICHK